MTLGILVEAPEENTSLIWLAERGISLECDSSLVPPNAFIGSWLWLGFSGDDLSYIRLHKHDIQVSLDPRGNVTMLDWCLLPCDRRGWAFSLTLGWIPLRLGFASEQPEKDTPCLFVITWIHRQQGFCITGCDQKGEGCFSQGGTRNRNIFDLLNKYNHQSDRCEQSSHGYQDNRNFMDEETEEWTEENILPRVGSSSGSTRDVEGREWFSAVVCGFYDAELGRMFFVASTAGRAILYASTLASLPDAERLRLGSYIHIRVIPFNGGYGSRDCSAKVVDVRFVEKPPDLVTIISGKNVQITCDAVLTGEQRTSDGEKWLLFENDFLGRLAGCLLNVRVNGHLNPGSPCRVTVVRYHYEKIPKDLDAIWIVTNIDEVDIGANSKDDREWSNAVVCGKCGGEGGGGTFFLGSSAGRALLYQDSLQSNFDTRLLSLGSYVQIRVGPLRDGRREGDSVMAIDARIAERPPDHFVHVAKNHISVSCDGKVVKKKRVGDGSEWLLIKNDYLGILAFPLLPSMALLSPGTPCRVTVVQRRFDQLPSELGVIWLVTELKPSSSSRDDGDCGSLASHEEARLTRKEAKADLQTSLINMDTVLSQESNMRTTRDHSGNKTCSVADDTLEEHKQWADDQASETSISEICSNGASMLNLESASVESGADSERSRLQTDCFRDAKASVLPGTRTRTDEYNVVPSKETELVRLVRRFLFVRDVRAALVKHDPDAYNDLLEMCLMDD